MLDLTRWLPENELESCNTTSLQVDLAVYVGLLKEVAIGVGHRRVASTSHARSHDQNTVNVSDVRVNIGGVLAKSGMVYVAKFEREKCW